MTIEFIFALCIVIGAPALAIGFFFGAFFGRADRHIKNEDWWV